MTFLHKFPEINLSPYAHAPGMIFSGLSMSSIFSLKQCRSANQRGTFVYMPSTLSGRATYAFWSCLEAVDSESQIRCHDISTQVSRHQSQPICTQTWNVFSGLFMSQHAQRFHLKQCRSANQRGTFVYMPSTLAGRATSAFW